MMEKKSQVSGIDQNLKNIIEVNFRFRKHTHPYRYKKHAQHQIDNKISIAHLSIIFIKESLQNAARDKTQLIYKGKTQNKSCQKSLEQYIQNPKIL